MAKSTRGLPPNFNLDIPDSVRDEPVQLGDYLDEVDAAPAAVRPHSPAPKKSESKVVEMPRVHGRPPLPRRRPSPQHPSRRLRPGESRRSSLSVNKST